jgi:integrase
VAWRGQRLYSIKTAFRRARERVQLDRTVVSYTLRHTMATELRKAGVIWGDVQGMLGHKIPGEADTYAKWSPDFRSQAARAIDDYWAPLRASYAPMLVGERGFEPPAPTSRT